MMDTRDGPQYTGSLLGKAMTLVAKGPVGELERIAAIDVPCTWAHSSDWPDREIAVGGSILMDFAPDEWTANVHLILPKPTFTRWRLRGTERLYPGQRPNCARRQSNITGSTTH